MRLVLEGLPNADQKFLATDALDQLALHHVELSDLGLLDYLHREQFPALFLLGQNDAAEGAPAQIFSTLVELGPSGGGVAAGCAVQFDGEGG